MPRPPSPSIRHCTIHLCPSSLCSRSIAATLAPSLANKEPSRHPLPSRSHRVIHCCCRQGAIARSLALKEPSHRPLPSLMRSRHAIPCRRGAVAPSIVIAVEESSRRPSPSRSLCAVHCHQSAIAPYPAIKEPLAVSTDNSGHSSRPSQASRPDGCHVASPHPTAFHLPVPLIAASPFVRSNILCR